MEGRVLCASNQAQKLKSASKRDASLSQVGEGLYTLPPAPVVTSVVEVAVVYSSMLTLSDDSDLFGHCCSWGHLVTCSEGEVSGPRHPGLDRVVIFLETVESCTCRCSLSLMPHISLSWWNAGMNCMLDHNMDVILATEVETGLCMVHSGDVYVNNIQNICHSCCKGQILMKFRNFAWFHGSHLHFTHCIFRIGAGGNVHSNNMMTMINKLVCI